MKKQAKLEIQVHFSINATYLTISRSIPTSATASLTRCAHSTPAHRYKYLSKSINADNRSGRVFRQEAAETLIFPVIGRRTTTLFHVRPVERLWAPQFAF